MLQEILLLNEERATVEDGVAAMAKLADDLRDVATPDGRTPAEITAEREGDLLPGADTGGQL
jgi:hypothetical protein